MEPKFMAVLEQDLLTHDVAQRVLILGGGFGGLRAAKTLCSKLSSRVKSSGAVKVLLIDKWNYHLFTPLLYQASTGKVDLSSVAQPIRREAHKSGFEFLEVSIKAINLQSRVVYADDFTIPYDYLVIALGSTKNDSNVKGAAEYAIPLKTLKDGMRIHNRIIESFERAESLSPKEREAYLNFVVIGGSTGAELAGSIVDYIKEVAKNYPKIDARLDCKVYVIERGERLFPDGEQSLSDIVKKSLEGRGVEVLLNTRVERIDHTRITLSSGETLRACNIFDNSGVKPNPVLETIPEVLAKKEKGKLVVDSYLRIPDFENVYAIGDNAEVVIEVSNGKHKHAPPTAEGAVEEAKYVGELIANELNQRLSPNSRPLRAEPFRYKQKATMLSIGAHTGIAKFPRITFTGLFGWLIWRVIHLYLVSTTRAKLMVAFDWILDLFGDINTSQMDYANSKC